MTNGQYHITNSTGSLRPTTTTAFTTQPLYFGGTGTLSVTKPRSRMRRIADRFRDLGLRLASERGGSLTGLPPGLENGIGGGSHEAETSRTIEHKKKIVLKRSVGIPREKGAGIEDTHMGTVTLVRTMEGDPNQLRNLGIKAEPKQNSYVEIPIDELKKAIQELEDAPVVDITKKKGKGR